MIARINHSCLRIVAVLAIALAASFCSAQDWSGNGPGNCPMSPSASSGVRDRPVIPGPPMQPTTTSRPSSWPGAASPWVPPDERRGPPPADLVPLGELKPCDGTRILARVGSEAILESEVAGAVNEFLQQNKDKIPPDQLDKYRELLTQKRLKGLIETKLVFQDAKRTIPTEGWSHIESQLTKEFEDVELEKMMKNARVNSPREFDQKLRALGTSLEREKRAFCERSIAQQWMHQQVKKDEEITYDQMVVYYRDHQADFTAPARAQWEELMARYSSYPNRAAAYQAIAEMGNQVLAGRPFVEVAKGRSNGFTAPNGGQCDWTTKGGLTCDTLDAALFSLPVGQMSPIIEGDKGFHIIRVTRREDTAVKPFLEAQVDIKKKILQQRTEKQISEYMAKIEARTPVWIFDNDVATPQLSRRPDQPSRR